MKALTWSMVIYDEDGKSVTVYVSDDELALLQQILSDAGGLAFDRPKKVAPESDAACPACFHRAHGTAECEHEQDASKYDDAYAVKCGCTGPAAVTP